MKKGIFLLLLALGTMACNSDDDICTSGEATPRLKLKFKNANNKEIKLDTLYIDINYGAGVREVVAKASVDSVFVPLRVDNTGSTELNIYTTKARTNGSVVRLNYTEKAEYVSPACGIRKLYQDLRSQLVTPNNVKNVELNQTEITNESKTHLYLIF